MGTLIQLFLLTLAGGLVSSIDQELLKTAILAAADGSTCSSECTNGISSGGYVGFSENMKYGYVFNGKTTIIAPSDSVDGTSEISITGLATIIGMQKCGAFLYLKNVEITQGSKVYGSKELEGSPVLFSYNNGKVGQNICSMSQDSIASMNLKRAIASVLQVSSIQGERRDIFETDVQGTCNTTYYSSVSGTTRMIIKDKDLTQCTKHEKINLFGSSLELNPVYQDSPFSAATQHSEIKIIDSVVKSVANSETFVYQPLGPIDVTTKIMASMNMELKKMSPARSPSSNPLDKSRSIIFEKPTSSVMSANADTLVAATQLAMYNLEPVVDVDGAKSFADLIELLKVANKDDILSAYQQVNSGTGFDDSELAEEVFINALTAANSGDSIGAVAELIDSHTLSDTLAISWFNNLANAQHPTKEAVVLASSLLSDKALKEGYIGVGTLLRQYLKDTRDYDSSEVANTLNNLGAPLKKTFDRSLSPEDEELAIASLKGLGNAQYLNSDLLDLSLRIIMDKTVTQRIRAAALVMIQSYAKNSMVEKACESIFKDISEDSELRILAFKVFSMNPSNYKATVIKNILDDKYSQLQIQAFLLSYLKNLQTTVDENKFDQKRFYEGIKPKSSKKMLSDILRYSQSLEFSHKCPLLRSGVLLDGEVIYSHKSYIARSSSASLKALIFGRQLNMFDFNVRVENIEPILGKLFGPEGYFAKNEGSTIDDIKNYVTQAINYANSRRLNNVDSEPYSKQDYENVPEEVEKLYIDVALKVLGNDVGWLAFQGLDNEVTYKHIIDAVFKYFDDSVPDKKNLEMCVTKQIPIIDYEKKYATSSGLPISIKIQATSAIKLNMTSTFDLDSYLKNPGNSNFAFKFLPSGSLTFNTLFTVDGSTVEVGYKVASVFHTSTGSDFSLKTSKGRGFQMVYGLPLDEIDVLSLKSGAFATVQEKGSPLSEIPLIAPNVERKTYTKALENVNNMGLTYDVQYEYPWNGDFKSLLPLSGPSSFSLKILKIDEKLTKYVVKGNYDLKSPTLKYIKLLFFTPKTDISRALELMVAYDTKTDDKFIAEFKTPSKKINLQSTFIDSDKQNTIEVKYIDGSEHVLNMGVKYDELDSETTKYSPIFEVTYSTKVNGDKIRHPLIPSFDVEGSFLVKRNVNSEMSYPSTLTLKDIAVITPNSKHSLQGAFNFENNELNGNAILSNGRVTINTQGFISGNYPIYKMNGALDMIANKQPGKRSLTDESDEYEPISKFVALLYKIENLSITMSQELHVESPYVFLSNNRMLWDDDHFEMNSDILIENNEITMHGNISTSDLLDSVLNANITVLPSTKDSSIFVRGLLQHSLVSDPSNIGYGDLKYVQNMDKRGSYFELNSDLPQTLGRFNLNTQHQSTDESFQSVLNYNIHDGTALKADMAIKTDDITLNMQFNSPNPKYKSFMNVHGWLEKENTYSFDTKVLWPGPQDSNYLNADGKMILNGLDSHMSGNIDFPSANLVNVYVSVESESDSEIEDGGIATVQFISNEQLLLSEKFKYKLTQNNGELHLAGESIHEESQNIIPISFLLEIKNYSDREHNNGKQIAYRFTMEHNGQKLLYQKFMQFTNHMISYRQINQIDDDEQKISMELEYNIKDAWNWSYRLKSKVISPSIFHYLVRDDQNLLECNSNIKFSSYTLDQGHTLKIVSANGTADLYEFRWFLNNEKTAIKMLYGQREIRGLGHYSLKSIQGGYHLTYSGELWLDHNTDSDSESTLTIDAYYSLNDGLSTASDVNIYVPKFNDKEMGVKSDIQVFKSWENPFNVKFELNIFPTTEQTLKVRSNLNRNVHDNGVLYSAEILAKSDGMKLDYAFRDSILVSSEKWGKYLDAYFIDSDNIKRPIQVYIELVPKGFINKINVFGISVINVNSSIDIQDDTLTINSIVGYNDRLYSFDLAMTSYPSFKYIMGWTGKSGNPEQLMVEGSITVDDSAVISATRIENNGKATPVGYITKSLEKPNWWETNNHMNTDQWNLVWKSLKGEFIERFIIVHSNLKNIIATEKSRRKVRAIEAKNASPQYHLLVEYTQDGWNDIFNEVAQDDYLLEIPILILNTTGAVFAEAKDLYENNLSRTLGRDIGTYSRKIYNYYLEQTDLFLNQMARDYDELLEQVKLTLSDMIKMFNQYIDKPLNLDSSEPRSFREYFNDIINKLIQTIEQLKVKLDGIQDKPLDYIQSLPIYDMFQDQIEKLKVYPYKEKLWEEIHNYLHGLELSAPTNDFASFINTLDAYINNVIHDNTVSQKDITNLRNKGIIVAKSIIFSFSDYVNYDRAMSMYYALNKLAELSNTMLYIVSPNTFQYPSDGPNMLFSFSDYIQLYRNYLNPSNLLPPYGVQSVIIASTNIITYNGQPYSFKPNTGTYMFAKDFTNNKFSIVGSYNDNTLTSISVSCGNNGEIFELLSGGRITVNGKNVDFPMIRDDVKTWKDVYYFGFDTADGVSIKSTINFDIVEVFINGYYYGQVFGLLGSMYQEPTFDSKLPNGQPSNNMESFVSAYRQTGNAKPTIIDQVETDQSICFNMFSGTSTMNEAFLTMEPTAYKALCNQVVSSAISQQDGLDKACLVAKAYVSMARQNFVSNCNIPNMCITTKVQQRTIDATTQVQISTPSDVADVMVLFEETADIEQPLSDLLNTFIQQITKNFNQKGIKDVNVIVIGYSGKLTDSEVHIYTANGVNDYSRILSNVPEWSESKTNANTNILSSQFVESFKKVIGKSSKDKAYKLSADYPFRMNAVKVVLSIAHSLYTQNYIDMSQYTFDYITSCYTEQGISFYLIAPIHLSDSSDNGIFGASGEDTIYTISAPKGKESSAEYTYDKSLETNLVLKTNGVMYDIQFFIDATDNTMQSFLRSLAETIVDNSVEVSTVEKSCFSSLYNGVMPYAKCTMIVTE